MMKLPFIFDARADDWIAQPHTLFNATTAQFYWYEIFKE